MFILEILKAVLFGIVEGITEWLPVSSPGHIILLDEFIRLQASEEFKSMFDVVIQLGAILAVIVIFFNKLNPFDPKKSPAKKKATWELWFKVCAAIVPSGVIGVLFDDWMELHLHKGIPVAIALIAYGVAFIYVERRNAGKRPRISKVWDIDWRTAILIGCFQCLSLVPGPSRSGSTILGAILLGVSRSAGSEISNFMAIPTKLGASLLTVVKLFAEGVTVTALEWGILAVGCVTAFLVSLAAIKFLMDFVKKHSFASFGWYRIVLGALVIGYFLIFGR